jgi:hypothetical protein
MLPGIVREVHPTLLQVAICDVKSLLLSIERLILLTVGLGINVIFSKYHAHAHSNTMLEPWYPLDYGEFMLWLGLRFYMARQKETGRLVKFKSIDKIRDKR